MYTAELISNSIQRAANQRVIIVKFSNGSSEFTKDFQFGLDIPDETIKRIVKQYKDKLETAESSNSLTAGPLDLSDVTTPAPTVDEQAQANWFADLQKLRFVDELIERGVLTGNETPVTNLRTKVRTNFKAAYIA